MRFIIRFIFGTIKFVISMAVALCIIVALIAAYAFYVAPERLGTEELNIQSEYISQDVDIAVIADTHFGAGFEAEDFDKVIEEINSKDVDYVLFLGDLIDNYSTYNEDVSVISSKLAQLEATSGKYAVFGNHDYGGGAENHYEDIMNEGGFMVLKNRSVTFPETGIRITGIDDLLLGYGDIEAANNATEDMYDLIMCHEPDIFDNLSSDNIDFMFAGHTHGGQINIPYLRDYVLPSLGSKYIKGQYGDDNMGIYVNPGLGTTKIKARLFSEPEVTYFHLSPE